MKTKHFYHISLTVLHFDIALILILEYQLTKLAPFFFTPLATDGNKQEPPRRLLFLLLRYEA